MHGSLMKGSEGCMFTTAQDVLHWMDRNCVIGIHPGLERMEWALNRLGHPERRCKWIHVAGTNGKGSTGAMISSILREAGYPVGVYLSPHILDWNERIQLDQIPISEESFVSWANYLYPYLEEMIKDGPGAPSPFEFWTLVAICYFALEACPWFVIWETGLGGRWDATNVVYPIVSVITQIGLDHKNFLGDNITEIAQEKSGIIKQGIPVVCTAKRPEAIQVIEETCKKQKSRLYLIDREFGVCDPSMSSEQQIFSFYSPFQELTDVTLGLRGEHQFENAAGAIMTIDILRHQYITVVEETHIRDGLNKVHWEGRWEIVQQHPTVILDGAHNEDGVKSLASSIKKIYSDRKVRLLVASMKDKESQVLNPIVDVADEIWVTEVSDQIRSRTAEELAEILHQQFPNKRIRPIVSPVEGIRELLSHSAQEDVVLITGSLYLVSEVRPFFV